MIQPLSFGQFAAGWLPALAVSTQLTPRVAEPFTVPFGGIDLPLVTIVLGAIGVLAARPLARKQEATLGITGFLSVTLIMLIAVELWIIEAQPGWLFAFVVAIGLGFSGYSLIELLGEELRELVRSSFALVKGRLRRVLGMAANESAEP